MLITCEGPDAAGKSVLTQKLAEALPGAEIIHHGPPPADRHVLDLYECDVSAYTPGSGRHLIFDRLQVGEVIYGPILRGVSRLTPAMHRHVDLLLAARGGVQVLLVPPTEILVERMARGDDLIKAEQLDDIRRAYIRQTGRFDTVWMSDLDPQLILRKAKKAEADVHALVPFPLYIGAPRPRVLVVGEKPGPNSKGRTGHHMCWAPYPESSGSYLIPCLDEALGTDCRAYGMVNAVNTDLSGLWKALSGPRVLALGNQASHLLSAARVPHKTVWHPAYMRRFKARDRVQYVQMIKEAVVA